MNKNTTILLGAIAVLAIGAGAYVSMSKPTNEGFTTQSFRKTVQSQPTTTVTDGENEDGGNGGVAGKPIVKYNSDATCSVTFDNGTTASGTTEERRNKGQCCYIENQDTCYSGREPGVGGVNYGTQPAEKKVKPEFSTQSVNKSIKSVKGETFGDIDTEIDDMGITVNFGGDKKCSVTFDDGITLNGTAGTTNSGKPCCGDIKGHGDICYSGREVGVIDVEFGTQAAEEKVMPEFSTQSVRKTMKNKQTAVYGNIETENDEVMGITIKYNSDATCSVTFDDGVTLYGETGITRPEGGPCCGRIEGHDVCYSGKEPGVAGVDYGTQPAEKKVMAEENYY